MSKLKLVVVVLILCRDIVPLKNRTRIMPRSRFNATNDRDTRLSSPWNAKSFKKVVQVCER